MTFLCDLEGVLCFLSLVVTYSAHIHTTLPSSMLEALEEHIQRDKISWIVKEPQESTFLQIPALNMIGYTN